MFLPFETSMSLWFSAVPKYEWVPLVPPAVEPGACGTADAPVAGDDGVAPQMHWVLVGIDWVGYPVWRAQANPAWDLAVRNRQDEADARGQEKARHARREDPPSIGVVPGWESPQSPPDEAMAKLAANKGTSQP